LKPSSNTTILTKGLFFLFCSNKPEAVEVTFAGKCPFFSPVKRKHNIKIENKIIPKISFEIWGTIP